MKSCRICASALAPPIYFQAAPAITSLSTTLDAPVTVYLCGLCEHAQSDDLENIRAFYDTEYQISAASEEHDQLYAVVDGRPVYRTQKQAEAALALMDLPRQARVLDYGCAKATTLRKIAETRPDIEPHVFDVSASYVDYWRTWLKSENCAVHEIPTSWLGSFDAITAHFVLEHVADPVQFLRTIRTLLKPNGLLFLSVPDPIANPGDLIVVDHLNHFTPISLCEAMGRAELAVERIERTMFAATLIALARKTGGATPGISLCGQKKEVLAVAEFWRGAADRLRAFAEREPNTPTAIFGAGFYGAWIATALKGRANIVCFIDNNPHVRATKQMGLPVFAPTDLPDDVRALILGLNPLKARGIVAGSPELTSRPLKFVYLT